MLTQCTTTTLSKTCPLPRKTPELTKCSMRYLDTTEDEKRSLKRKSHTLLLFNISVSSQHLLLELIRISVPQLGSLAI